MLDSKHKLLLGKNFGLPLDPSGDTRLSLPELEVRGETLQHET